MVLRILNMASALPQDAAANCTTPDHRTAPVDQTRKVGEFLPRKLLKKAGNIEMWQVETPGPRGRNMPLVQYEVCGATGSTLVFSRPNLALERFHQLSTGAAANG